MRGFRNILLWSLCGVAFLADVARADTRSTRADCFPVERLSARDQVLARNILNAALGGAALYTLASDLKPVSLDIHDQSLQLHALSSGRFQQLLRVTAALHCGEIGFHVLLRRHPGDNSETADEYLQLAVVREGALKRKVTRERRFFTPLGIESTQPVAMILDRVNNVPGFERFTALGLVLGYPREAVEFYTDAAEVETLGHPVARSFVDIPIDDPAPLGHLKWAVPKGHRLTAEEKRFRAQAKKVLKRYRSLRWKLGAKYPEKILRSLLFETSCTAALSS